ncbi:MAG: gliding motility-associated C-terminal domain-containing protein [Bacteroidales bacterium]|nr:gliding motility-associated C-terminal domain-containing protein [Bacteroidales bacterium]
MKKHLILTFILFPLFSFSQLDISITSNIVPIYPSDGDTLSACRDSLIIFEAIVTDGGSPVTGAEYFWDFDNGIKPFGTDVDSVTYIFSEGGGYRIKLKVTKGANEGFAILPLKVAMRPNYEGTKVNLPEEQDGICISSTAPITGKAYPELWEDGPVYEIIENPYDFFEFNDGYTSVLNFDEFGLDSVYKSGYIDSIGINILHADMGDLQIKLLCENGNSVILKDYAPANHALLGDTVLNEAYFYYWSQVSGTATMNSNTTDAIIPSSSYLPDESFDNLIGCSLNGDWTIEIDDNQELDSGFIFSWNIVFRKDILPDVWKFKDTLVQYNIVNNILYGTYWSGNNINASSVITSGDTIISNSSASPDSYGTKKYNYHVITNWGCPQDTFINLLVEEVVIDAASTVQENDTIVFTDKTSWAFERDWDFGDKETAYRTTDTVSHKYIEKGEYEVILYATDKNGCTDTDTVTIEVTVEPSKLSNIPNMFSPDSNDEINKTFKIPKESLAGMEEFQMTIYNRWGDRVYHTNSMDEIINEGWDGKNLLGIKASPGVYFYVIKATGKDGIIYKGVRNPDKIKKVDNNDETIISTETTGTIHLFR